MDLGTLAAAAAASGDDRYGVVSIPGGDMLFRHVVDRHVRSARRRGTPIRAVRRALRQRYPDAELSRQRDCRIQGKAVELWFAYRGGRHETIAPPRRWWDERGWARVSVAATGRLVGANAAFRRLMDLPPGGRVSLTLREVVPPELFRELWLESKRMPAAATLDGTLTFRLPSGRRLDVEFHARRRDGTALRVQIALRSLADRDRANEWWALRQSALGSAPTALLRELVRSGTRHKLGAGQRLATSLTDDAWLVVVTAGIMRLYLAVDGSEPTLGYGNFSSLLGTHAVVPTETLRPGLQAVTSGVVLQLSARRVREMATAYPAFQRALCGDVRFQLGEVIRSFAGHAAGDLRQRLAREIVVLSDLHPDDELLRVTEQQLADGIGSIRESVGRSIGELRRDGSIVTTRHGLLILDKARLRRAGLGGADLGRAAVRQSFLDGAEHPRGLVQLCGEVNEDRLGDGIDAADLLDPDHVCLRDMVDPGEDLLHRRGPGKPSQRERLERRVAHRGQGPVRAHL
jgi:CRP/FNR family transcriptional regulator